MTENPDELIPTRQSLLGRLKDWEDQASWREFFDTYWRLIYLAKHRISKLLKQEIARCESELL